MKRYLLTLLRAIPLFIGLIALPATGLAQTHGYGFIGGTFGDQMGGAFRYGFGGAWAIVPHVTAGAELGGMSGSGVIGSGNLGFHLLRRPKGIDPFFTAGISGVRMSGGSGFYGNIGGGANYWFRPRIGFRAEFRAYPGGMDLNSFSELRFGVSFR